MKDNAYKCLLIVLILRARDSNQIQIENSFIKSYLSEKRLGVKFDHQLSFDQQVKSLCKKGNAKLKAFTRVVDIWDEHKKKLIMNSFFAAQFNYGPLTWMIHRRFNIIIS